METVGEFREHVENTFRRMAQSGWAHPTIGTIQYAVFVKLFFGDPQWYDIHKELLELTSWEAVDEKMVNLPNGDVVVTVILKVA